MPLFAWKKNIGKNIKTELSHGKKPKVALAIALNVAKVPKKESKKGDKMDKKMGTKEGSKKDMNSDVKISIRKKPVDQYGKKIKYLNPKSK